VRRMTARMRRLALLCFAVSAVITSPAGAATMTGTISTPVVSADGASVTAQVTMASSCVTVGDYCGFFPEVTTVALSEPCSPQITGSAWVGPVLFSSVGSPGETLPPTIAAWREWPTLYSGGKRACLYAYSGGTESLVAETTYVVPTPPAPSVYVPPVVTTTPTTPAAPVSTTTVTVPIPGLPFLSRTDGVEETRRYVKRKYGHRWSLGRGRVVRCPVRSSDAQLGCYAVWRYRTSVLSKSIVLTEKRDGSFVVSRDFASAPAQTQTVRLPSTTTPAATTTPSPDDFCSTHICIPNYDNGTGTTVQCSDGTYSHSGGKQGACSHHGGVSHSMVARPSNAATLARAFSRALESRAAATGAPR
jgi:hypothetical protein